MLLNFTPFSFLFSIFYFIFLYSITFFSDFYMFWVVIECSSFIFVGLCFSLLSYGFSRFILYFIIQALSSVRLLFFYIIHLDLLFFTFLIFKLAVFPFSFWFYPVVCFFPNLVFFICSTFHKFPTILLFSSFCSSFSYSYFWLACIFTLAYSSFSMLYLNTIRSILIFSSVGNNVWILSSSIVSFELFLLFFVFYSFNLFLVINFLGSLSITSFIPGTEYSIFFTFSVLSSAGFPPFPIFFLKLYTVYFLLNSFIFIPVLFFLFLIFVVIIMASYFKFIMSFYTNLYASFLNFFVF